MPPFGTPCCSKRRLGIHDPAHRNFEFSLEHLSQHVRRMRAVAQERVSSLASAVFMINGRARSKGNALTDDVLNTTTSQGYRQPQELAIHPAQVLQVLLVRALPEGSSGGAKSVIYTKTTVMTFTLDSIWSLILMLESES